MKVGIMQPYLFPYIGYFQLLNGVDKFIIYDNIQYTKKGWINRNRILVNGKDEYISFPLKKGSDFLNIGERELADTFNEEKTKLLNKLSGCYRKAPEFNKVFSLVENCINFEKKNLFEYIANSIYQVCNYLEIKTEIITSSTIRIDHQLKSQDKVIAMCKSLNAKVYINPIGGVELYNKDQFLENSIQLHFLQSEKFEYSQFGNEFKPWLSIIDVMMFNKKDEIKNYLDKNYTLI